MSYSKHDQANEVSDSIASNSFCTINFTTIHSTTLIDNTFSNVIDPNIIPANLNATIFDHLPQFAIIPDMFGNISGNKSNIYERD